MSRKSEFIRKHERMEITLATVLEHYSTSKKLKGCSPKTLIAIRSILERFIRFLQQRGHLLKLTDLDIDDARAYVASLHGKITKYEGHTFNRPVSGVEYSPQTIHSHVRMLRAFSNWLRDEGYTKTPLFERLELPKLPKVKITVLTPEEIRQILASINPNTFLGCPSQKPHTLGIGPTSHCRYNPLIAFDSLSREHPACPPFPPTRLDPRQVHRTSRRSLSPALSSGPLRDYAFHSPRFSSQ